MFADILPEIPVGKALRRILVSPATYQRITRDMEDSGAVPAPVVEGTPVRLDGVELVIDLYLPDGSAALIAADGSLMDVVLLENEPALPLDPYERVASISRDPERPDAWIARDAEGSRLLDLTERGAKALAARKGLPVSG